MSKEGKRAARKKLLRQGLRRRGKIVPSREKLTTRNHYVPIWYQKRFIRDGSDKYFYLRRARSEVIGPNGRALMSDKLLSDMRPQQCFVENNLYTVSLFGVPDDAIERQLFGEIDGYGSRSIDAIVEERGWCQEGGTDLWKAFVAYMGAQKLRTPKGLDWIREILRLPTPPGLLWPPDKIGVLATMQQILQMHGTIWTECVWEIVVAENAEVKFLISDDPVTMYNPARPPGSPYCKYPHDPLISLIGTRTLFPLDKNHCLILTNRQNALQPDKVDPLAERINARYFDEAIFSFLDVIRNRSLNNQEVATINMVVKSRARQCIAAGEQEWLYPEKILSGFQWKDADRILRPERDKVKDTKSIFFGHLDGSIEGYNPYGQQISDPEELESIKQSLLTIKKKVTRKDHFSDDVVTILNKEDNPSLRQQNEILLDAGKEIFGLNQGKTLEDLRHGMSDQEVGTFYRLIEDLWPAGLDTIRRLPTPDEAFTIIYSGELDPFSVSLYMLSFGIYAEKIFMVNPFPNPCCFKKEKSPALNPNPYKATTYRFLYLLFEVLEPWIRAGIVQLIPNPLYVDFSFRGLTMEYAEKRREGFSVDDFEAQFQMANFQKDMFWRTPMVHHRKIMQERMPEIGEEEIKTVLAYIEKVKETDPTEYLPSLDATGSQYCIQHFGLNLETLLYLAHLTGAVPYTHLNTRKRELLAFAGSTEDEGNWAALSNAITSERPRLLGFHNAPFAVELRKMGFLAKMQAYFAKLKEMRYTGVAHPDENLPDTFRNVVSATEQEWLTIEKLFRDGIGAKNYRESGGASFKVKLTPCFGEYSLDYLTNYLNSKFGEDRAISPVRMAIYMELPHTETHQA